VLGTILREKEKCDLMNSTASREDAQYPDLVALKLHHWVGTFNGLLSSVDRAFGRFNSGKVFNLFGFSSSVF